MCLEPEKHLKVLRRVSDIVSSKLSLEKMLAALVELTVEAMHCDACLVYLTEPSSSQVVLRASQLQHKTEIGNIRLKLGEGVTGWVARHKSVVALSHDAASDPRFKVFPALPEDTYEALLSVPLISSGELIGVMNLHYREEHSYATDEIALGGFIGKQMGGAIAKSKLGKRSETAARRMGALAGLTSSLSGEAYLTRLLQIIAEMVAKNLESPICSILLLDADGPDLMIRAAGCSAPDYLRKVPFKIEESLVGGAMQDGQPLQIHGLPEKKLYGHSELARTAGLASLLSVPLVLHKKVIGLINVYTTQTRHFGDDEVGFVSTVAAQATIAIQNVRLIAETLQMKRDLEDRTVIERAKSILQQKYSFTEEEAYLRLRKESRRLRRPMRELAESILLADDMERPA
jgi:signal transduction protein with GAF and PtsI domain